MATKKFTTITRVVLLLIFFFFLSMALFAQHNPLIKEEAKKEVAFPKASQYSQTKLGYTIIDAPNKTYGYDINASGRLMIHQASIPAMQGNEGFKTKAAAEKVAQLVIKKIKKGEMPPTIDVKELKKLKII
ncbi:hypothetical protein BH11BAC4_BH11BAC4_01330 [soil metagenome]